MKVTIIALLLLQAASSFGADDPYSEADWLGQGFAQQIPKFKRTTLTPHPERQGIIAANCETSLSWWGRLQVFSHGGDKIEWVASVPESYAHGRGHYVLSCEWRYLEKLQMWILEVFDSTHMGNGSLWLFALEEQNLRLLLHTTARGQFLKPPANLVVPAEGERRLVEPRLNVDYKSADGGAADAEAVFLSGTIAALDATGNTQSAKPYLEMWTWDASRRVFSRVQP
ncbi:MAG TPA: hypothetical protein VF593_12930 [Chthoniobacteraceae bacterium]|jgi:hypothetical protein